MCFYNFTNHWKKKKSGRNQKNGQKTTHKVELIIFDVIFFRLIHNNHHHLWLSTINYWISIMWVLGVCKSQNNHDTTSSKLVILSEKKHIKLVDYIDGKKKMKKSPFIIRNRENFSTFPVHGINLFQKTDILLLLWWLDSIILWMTRRVCVCVQKKNPDFFQFHQAISDHPNGWKEWNWKFKVERD